MPVPSWLPGLAAVNGDWDELLRRLHGIFLRDFRDAQLRCGDLPVKWDTTILGADNCCEGFWHLITKTDTHSGQRLFEPRRAERLPWAGPLIGHSSDPRVKCWEYLEGSRRTRIYIWLEELDYIVILERQKKVARLVTGFYIEGNSTRDGLNRKFKRRIKANAAH